MPDAHFYLAPWRWNAAGWEGEGHWEAPRAHWRYGYDMRPLAAHARPVSDGALSGGVALWLSPQREVDEAGLIYLGASLAALQGARVRGDVRAALGLADTIGESMTALDIVRRVAMDWSDPSRQNRSGCLLPTHRGLKELWLGGERVYAARFGGEGDEASNAAIEQVRRSYRLKRDRSDAAADPTLAARWMSAMRRKMGVQFDDLLPAEDRGVVREVEPTTTIIDAFTDSNGTAMDGRDGTDGAGTGQGYVWDQIFGSFDAAVQGNRFRSDSNPSRNVWRALTDLSSDDMVVGVDNYADAGTAETGTRRIGVWSRYAGVSGAEYAYFLRADWDPTPASRSLTLGKIVNGFGSVLDSETLAWNDTGDRSEVDADGGTVKGIMEGDERFSVSDSEVSGQTRAGIEGFRTREADDWSAADKVAGGGLPAGSLFLMGVGI